MTQSAGVLCGPKLPPKQRKVLAVPVRSESEQSLTGRAVQTVSDQAARVKARRVMSMTFRARPDPDAIQMLPVVREAPSPPPPEISLAPPPSSQSNGLAVQEEKGAVARSFERREYPFLRHFMFFHQGSRTWDFKDCEKHAGDIAAFYAAELKARGIPFVPGSLNSSALWESLEKQLKEFDGPDLGKIMDVLVPKLKKMGYFSEKAPDMWEALWYLSKTTDAVKKITQLSVENAELARVPFCLGWVNWPNLQEISFARNRLERFPLTFLLRCPSLRSLCLCRNFLEKLPEDLLTHMPDLSVLDVSGNRIVSLPEKLGAPPGSAHRLVVFGLQNNRIIEIPEEAVKKLGVSWRVQYTLDLSGNVIPPGKMPKEIPKNVFLIQDREWGFSKPADRPEGKEE